MCVAQKIINPSRIRHNNAWVETSFELIVTEYGLTNTGDSSPISIEVANTLLTNIGNNSGMLICNNLLLGGWQVLSCLQT